MKKCLIVERLEAINMSEPERRRALHALQTGYAIADGIFNLVQFVRSLRRRMTLHTAVVAKH